MLKRKIAKDIEAYLKSDSNKILLVDGARQIGKTYIINEVGRRLFDNFIEINFAQDSITSHLFENIGTVEDFYLQVRALAGEKWKIKKYFNFYRWDSNLSQLFNIVEIFKKKMIDTHISQVVPY